MKKIEHYEKMRRKLNTHFSKIEKTFWKTEFTITKPTQEEKKNTKKVEKKKKKESAPEKKEEKEGDPNNENTEENEIDINESSQLLEKKARISQIASKK